MKKLIKLIAVIYMVLSISSCLGLSPKEQAESKWSNTKIETYFLKFNKLASNSKAINVIKLNQPNFVEWQGEDIVGIEVSEDGLLIKTFWEKNEQQTTLELETVTIGKKKIPTLVSKPGETIYSSGANSYSLIFKNINYIMLRLRNDLSCYDEKGHWCDFRYQIIFYEKDSDEAKLHLRVKSEVVARDIVDAIYTLAVNSGATINKHTVGISYENITESQNGTLERKIDSGVHITSVSVGGKFYGTGIQTNDIITAIDNTPIKDEKDFEGFIEKVKRSNKRKYLFHIIRITDFVDGLYKFRTEENDYEIVL